MLTLFVMVLGQSVKALIVLLALFGAVGSAQAQQHRTGNDLYENCREKRQVEYVASGLCLGYIEGVFDTISETMRLCGWGGPSNGQLKDIVLQYLYEHPAERHKAANWLVTRAMLKAFPCQQGSAMIR
jgi:hypothetical protein